MQTLQDVMDERDELIAMIKDVLGMFENPRRSDSYKVELAVEVLENALNDEMASA